MTEQLTSSLPSMEQVRAEKTMKIEQIDLYCYPRLDDVVTNFFNAQHEQLVMSLYTIKEPRVQGYLPTKVWIDSWGEFRMSFYTCDGLPSAVRPFGDKPMYVLTYCAEKTETMSYDSEVRVLIDQVLDKDNDVHYVFVFGEEQLRELIPDAVGLGLVEK